MKKIDYALENIPKCWDDMNEREVLDCLCPSDVDLEDINSCSYIYSDDDDIICEKCWNEEIKEPNE